jgi:two-component system invasion response regulator UvrY
MIRLAIVDDHAIVRAGFREMLNEELGMSIQFEAGTAEEAQSLLRQHNCDVLMLDLSLPDQNGIDLLRAVKQRHEETQVLIISSFSEERYALSMIRSGASGSWCKDCDRSVGAIFPPTQLNYWPVKWLAKVTSQRIRNCLNEKCRFSCAW